MKGRDVEVDVLYWDHPASGGGGARAGVGGLDADRDWGP